MTYHFIIVPLIIFVTLFSCNRTEHSSVPVDSAIRYKAGQVWKYKTRQSEPNSVLKILKVEYYSDTSIVIHIAVENVHIRNVTSPSGFNDRIPHLPLSEQALDSSVVKLIDENATLPEFQEGYNIWKRSKGGVFTVTVAEAVDLAEQALNK